MRWLLRLNPIYYKASDAARFNRENLEKTDKCGCYCCLKIFNPKEIEEWGYEDKDFDEEEDGVTAICPYCGIDSVLADNSGFPITEKFLKKMKKRWFY